MPISKKFFLWPTRLKMHFLPPVSSADTSVKDLKEKVYNVMVKDYVENV